MSSKSHLPGLDGLRGLAILLVIFSHSLIYGDATLLTGAGHNAGAAGVTVFFVLSGYLITRLLLREEERAGRISLGLFYARRGLRLLPALWLYLAVLFALWSAGLITDHPWHSFAAALLYVRNFIGHGHETGHLWSLSIEEQFYLVWPLLLIFLRRRDRTRLTLALLGVVSITVWRVVASGHGLASVGQLYMRSDFRFDAPLLGCAVALVERIRPREFSAVARRGALVLAAGLAGLGAWLLTGPYDPGIDPTVLALIGVPLVVSQAEGSLLAWSPLAFLGQISYGVYLWQQLFLGPSVPGLAAVRAPGAGLGLTFASALLSYYLLERPLLRLKERRFSAERERPAAVEDATARIRALKPAADTAGARAS